MMHRRKKMFDFFAEIFAKTKLVATFAPIFVKNNAEMSQGAGH